jgi:hypothetical protein
MTSDIKPKDVYRWFKSETAKGIHQSLEGYWDVKIPFPGYKITNDGRFSYYHGSENIWVDPEELVLMKKIFSSAGWNLSAHQIFLMGFGEEDTHYINDVCNKSNWERRKQLRPKFLNEDDYDSYLDDMSIRMQLEGIGSLGFRLAGIKIQIYDPLKYRDVVEKTASVNNESTIKEISLMEGILIEHTGKTSEEGMERLKKEMEFSLFAVKSGGVATVLGFYVGNEFEKLSEEERKGLISMNLTPREEDKKLYETVCKSKTPLVYDFIKSFLSKNKD